MSIKNQDNKFFSDIHYVRLMMRGWAQTPNKLRGMYSELTSREAEMLKWCADGKTSDEIAIILNVKKRTVDFHIANAIVKLNVSNKTAAAVRAIQLNIL